jgi:hypothetical protein
MKTAVISQNKKTVRNVPVKIVLAWLLPGSVITWNNGEIDMLSLTGNL